MTPKSNINRRTFLGTAAASAVFTVVPRSVLGGAGFIAPSDKVNLGYIGCGTQGLREMCGQITNPLMHITSVCDPNKNSTDYVDWSLHGIRNGIRGLLKDPAWGEGITGIPGGRDVGQEVVEKYYAGQSSSGKYSGCRAYADFREMLEKESDLDAVKVMTPDHLHATICIAAMKKGIHTVVHKPIANRMYEARLTIDTAQKTGARSHLLAWSSRSGPETALAMIRAGAIGTLREIHNWSNRPVWPQWASFPADTPPVPAGLDWDLWLGPVPDRPFHPNFTHAVFRGWYDFGAGSMADMGHYSLWPLFNAFGIDQPPVFAEAWGSTSCAVTDHVSHGVRNDVAFPQATIQRFRLPAQGGWPAFDLFWYDGGMKPQTPEELLEDGQELTREGMMLVGDQGKIIASFHCDQPKIIPERKMKEWTASVPEPQVRAERGESVWLEAFRDNRESPGSFLKARAISETINLGAVALRAGRRIQYNSADMKIPNYPEAEKYFYREYRKGWEL
jgi:hypothetical protein